MGSIFVDIAVIIFVAAFMALLFRALKQPLVLSYIVTGFILGPVAIYQLQNREALHTFAQLGVTLVLFVLGLELRLKDLKTLGISILVVGVGQILITGGLFFGLASFLQFPYLSAVYLAIAMTFSSTIVIVKLLSEKKDLTSLYGKLSVGILLVQDFVAVAILIVLSGLSTHTSISPMLIAGLLFKGIVVASWVYVMSKTVLPFLLRVSARSSETLFLFSLAWVFSLAAIMAAPGIGFSIEIGGFMAGLAMANFSENFQIIAKVRSLRDFFITIFFVLLGVDMTFGNIREVVIPAVLFGTAVFFLKPYIVMVLLGLMGYKKRTAFLTGLTMGQISEFSLIVLFLGKSLGHIPGNLVSFVTLIALLGFGVSSVLIQRGNVLYKHIEPFILFFEGSHRNNREVSRDLGDLDNHVVVVGGHQMGQSIVHALTDAKEDVIVVDFDPDIVDRLEKKGITHLFGDIIDSEIQDIAKLEKARLVISTVPDIEDNLLLIKTLNHENRRAKIIVVAYEKEDAKALYRAGADYVVLPHLAGGMHLAKIIKDKDLSGIEKMKDKDFLELV